MLSPQAAANAIGGRSNEHGQFIHNTTYLYLVFKYDL